MKAELDKDRILDPQFPLTLVGIAVTFAVTFEPLSLYTKL